MTLDVCVRSLLLDYQPCRLSRVSSSSSPSTLAGEQSEPLSEPEVLQLPPLRMGARLRLKAGEQARW